MGLSRARMRPQGTLEGDLCPCRAWRRPLGTLEGNLVPAWALQSPAKAPGAFQRATRPCWSSTAAGCDGDPPSLVAVQCPPRGEQREAKERVALPKGPWHSRGSPASKGCSWGTFIPRLPQRPLPGHELSEQAGLGQAFPECPRVPSPAQTGPSGLLAQRCFCWCPASAAH